PGTLLDAGDRQAAFWILINGRSTQAQFFPRFDIELGQPLVQGSSCFPEVLIPPLGCPPLVVGAVDQPPAGLLRCPGRRGEPQLLLETSRPHMGLLRGPPEI